VALAEALRQVPALPEEAPPVVLAEAPPVVPPVPAEVVREALVVPAEVVQGARVVLAEVLLVPAEELQVVLAEVLLVPVAEEPLVVSFPFALPHLTIFRKSNSLSRFLCRRTSGRQGRSPWRWPRSASWW